MIVLLLLSCCVAEAKDKKGNDGCQCSKAPLDSVKGMINYLAPLPAVWGVKKWNNPYSDGLIIETKHYRIYTTMMEPLMLKQLPAFVEAAYRGYQSQLPRPVDTGSDKFDVYLFKSRGQWEVFTKKFTGDQWQLYLKIKKGAYFLNGSCVTYNIGRTRTFSVIGHEGWHQFCHKVFRYRLPSWLDEGIAQLFEASEYEGGKFVFKQSKNYSKLDLLKFTLQNNRMVPLRELISLNPGQVVMWDESSRAVMEFYAQSYALVRFLREDGYGRRLGNYHRMLVGALNGSWPISADEARIASDRSIPLTARWNSYIAQKLFAVYVGEDINSIEAQYRNFCRKIVYHIKLKNEN